METGYAHIEAVNRNGSIRRNLPAGKSLILFDGVCNLCNGWVNFVIERDPQARFLFAPLQSEAARTYVEGIGALDQPDSILLIEQNGTFVRSEAVFRVLEGLSGAWPLLTALRIIPRTMRDWVYDQIANKRHTWFGERDHCRIPTQDLAPRFL